MANTIAKVLTGVAVLSFKKVKPTGEPDVDAALTAVGYTEDGVTLEYSVDTADVEVEEETFAINRVITKETIAVTCNFAESSLLNIGRGMIGAKLDDYVAPALLILGGGTIIDEAFTSVFDVAVQLIHSMIDHGSEVVTNNGTTYTRGTDYTMDYRNGTITVLSTGTMANTTGYLIDYNYSASSNIIQLQIIGSAPPVAGVAKTRTVAIAEATATGTVGMSYKKGGKTIIPVTFQAIQKQATNVCTITDEA